ncbi:proline-rich protein 36-like [Eriocheir sinensis]|uniref:proline-rich protein 36-like n=1 Tax=Eriocheir sinensis TaxID=95602 RepID=UPI0021C89938|nr:proline-rich protein 36-like [Eriocheir sinensis]
MPSDKRDRPVSDPEVSDSGSPLDKQLRLESESECDKATLAPVPPSSDDEWVLVEGRRRRRSRLTPTATAARPSASSTATAATTTATAAATPASSDSSAATLFHGGRQAPPNHAPTSAASASPGTASTSNAAPAASLPATPGTAPPSHPESAGSGPSTPKVLVPPTAGFDTALDLAEGKPVTLRQVGEATTKGVVTAYPVAMPLNALLRHPDVLSADRCLTRDGLATRQVMITLKGPLPGSLDLGSWGVFYTRPFNKEPLRCYCCQQFGHHRSRCNRPAVCGMCSGPHITEGCLEKIQGRGGGAGRLSELQAAPPRLEPPLPHTEDYSRARHPEAGGMAGRPQPVSPSLDPTVPLLLPPPPHASPSCSSNASIRGPLPQPPSATRHQSHNPNHSGTTCPATSGNSVLPPPLPPPPMAQRKHRRRNCQYPQRPQVPPPRSVLVTKDALEGMLPSFALALTTLLQLTPDKAAIEVIANATVAEHFPTTANTAPTPAAPQEIRSPASLPAEPMPTVTPLPHQEAVMDTDAPEAPATQSSPPGQTSVTFAIGRSPPRSHVPVQTVPPRSRITQPKRKVEQRRRGPAPTLTTAPVSTPAASVRGGR